MAMGDYITIPKSLIMEEEIKDIAISVYLITRTNKLFLGDNNQVFDREDLDICGVYTTSISQIIDFMNIDSQDKIKKITKEIKKSLIELHELELLRFFKDDELENEIDPKDIDKNTFLFVMDTSLDNYTHIYKSELKKILRYKTKANNYSIVRYLMYLTSKIFYNTTSEPFCYSTQRKALSEIGIDKETKNKYEDILQELNILKTIRSVGSIRTEDGGYKTCKTYHCRVDDYEELDNYIKGLVKAGEIILLSEEEKKDINEKRRATMIENSVSTKSA